MKKVIVIAGIAFLVSLAAGVGGRMALAPPPAAEGEAAETSLDGPAEGVHGQPVAPHAGPAAVNAGAPAQAAAAVHPDGSVPADAGASGADDARGAAETDGYEADGASSPPRVGQPIEFREMGLILASMEPQEAGLFLSYLDDQRAAGLLRAMTVAEAASILHSVPEDRGKRLRGLLLAELGEKR